MKMKRPEYQGAEFGVGVEAMEASPIKLDVVSVEETRETVPMGRREDGSYADMATGKSVSRLFVRGPSGRLYVLDAPGELTAEVLEEIGKSGLVEGPGAALPVVP